MNDSNASKSLISTPQITGSTYDAVNDRYTFTVGVNQAEGEDITQPAFTNDSAWLKEQSETDSNGNPCTADVLEITITDAAPPAEPSKGFISLGMFSLVKGSLSEWAIVKTKKGSNTNSVRVKYSNIRD